MTDSLKSQILIDSDYGRFKSYFELNKDGKEKSYAEKEIPLDLAKRIFGEEIINSNVTDIVPHIKIRDKYNPAYIIELGCPAGGQCFTLVIVLFSDDFSFLKVKFIGGTGIDAGGGDICSARIVKDNLIESYTKTVEFRDDTDEEILIDEKYEYFLVQKNDIVNVKLDKATEN